MQVPNPENMHNQWGEIKQLMGSFISCYETIIEKYKTDGSGLYEMGYDNGYKASQKEKTKECAECKSNAIIQEYHLDNLDNRCLFDNYFKLKPSDKKIVQSIVEALTAKEQMTNDCTKPHF